MNEFSLIQIADEHRVLKTIPMSLQILRSRLGSLMS